MKAIDRLKKSYADVRRFSGLLRNYSIFATATATGQLVMLTQKSFTHSDTLDWRIFLTGFAAGLYAGWVLENYYESSVKELEQYGGKSYTQRELKVMQNNTEWGFKTALSFNVLTFAAGTCAVIISAYQLLSPVDAALQKNFDSVSRDINRYEKRIEKLDSELDSTNIENFRDEVLLEQKKRAKKKKAEINRIFEMKIEKEIEREKTEIEALNGWKRVEEKKKSNRIDNFRTLQKKYRQKLAQIKKPLAELEQEYKSRLKSLSVSPITVVEAKENYILNRKREIGEIEAKLEAKKKELESLAKKIGTNSSGIEFWKAALISILLAVLYYFYQNRNYRYQETLVKKIRDEETLENEPIIKTEPFDPEMFSPDAPVVQEKRKKRRDVTDDEILFYMYDTWTDSGALPGREQIKNIYGLHTTELRDFYRRHDDKFIKEADKKPVPSEKFFEFFEQVQDVA